MGRISIVTVTLGLALIASSVIWTSRFGPKPGWTEEDAQKHATTASELHSLAFQENRAAFDEAKARFDQQKKDIDAAVVRHQWTGTILKWTGITLSIAGIVYHLVLRKTS